MLHPQEESVLVETSPRAPLAIQEIPDHKALSEPVLTTNPHLKIPKRDIRKSLKALTTEGAFATVFYSIIGGALLSNFLLDLGAIGSRCQYSRNWSARLNSSANQFAATAGSLCGRPHQEPPLVFAGDFRLLAAAVVADCAGDLVGQHISDAAAPFAAVDIGNYLPE